MVKQMIKQADRMAFLKPGIFNQLAQAISERKQAGYDLIDLSLGSPDLPPIKKIREKLSEEALKETSYGYTLGGMSRFNAAVSRYYARVNQVELEADTEVLQTMGSQEGLIHLPLAFCNPGDKVLITNPAYTAYEAGIRLAGAEPYALPLKKESNYLPDLNALSASVLKKAKLLILNFPGNPVPSVATREFFTEVVTFAKENELLVLHDAAYSEFYYTDEAPLSFLAVEGAKEVGLETNSLSKSFSLAGARIAYFAGNKQAIKLLKSLKSNLDYGVFAPIQEAGILALDHSEEITKELRKVFKARHKLMYEGLNRIGWKVQASRNGMFIWAKYPEEVDDVSYAFNLIKEKGIAVVPGSAFGSEGKGYVRIALVEERHVLRQALEILEKMR